MSRAVWWSQDPRDQEWGKYDPTDTALLEKSYQGNKQPVVLDFGDAKFTVDVKKMTQNNNSGGSRPVKREESKGPSGSMQKFTEQVCPKDSVAWTPELMKLLDIELAGTRPFLLAYLLACTSPWSAKKREVLDGFTDHHVESVASCKKKLAALEGKVKGSVEEFLKFMAFCFLFCRADEKANYIALEDAVGYYKCLWALAPSSSQRVETLLDFMAANTKGIISKDLWCQSAKFLLVVKADFSNYDEKDCYPLVIDDFVEHYRQKK